MGAITAPGEEPVSVGGGGHRDEEASERWVEKMTRVGEGRGS